jgi:Flp pilus assembly pilin Flp
MFQKNAQEESVDFGLKQRHQASPREVRPTVFRGVNEVKTFKGFLLDERGAELAEYAVGTAILVAIAIIVYQVLGSAINIKMNAVANEIQK